MRVSLPSIINPGEFQKKPILPAHKLQISALGKRLGCVGVFLPGSAVASSGSVGPTCTVNGSQMVWVGSGNALSTIEGTVDGIGWRTTGAARQETGCNLYMPAVTTQLQFSIITRLQMTTAPSGSIAHTGVGKVAGSGGAVIGFNSSGFARAACTTPAK